MTNDYYTSEYESHCCLMNDILINCKNCRYIFQTCKRAVIYICVYHLNTDWYINLKNKENAFIKIQS